MHASAQGRIRGLPQHPSQRRHQGEQRHAHQEGSYPSLSARASYSFLAHVTHALIYVFLLLLVDSVLSTMSSVVCDVIYV